MEMPQPSEWTPRPEFDKTQPAGLFTYAKAKEAWIRRSLENDMQLPTAVDLLADELETFVDSHLSSREVHVASRDIQYTTRADGGGALHTIESGVLPIDVVSGLQEELRAYEGHTINGALFGFHRGTENDLRAYVDIGDGVRKWMGGVYTPLLSVGVKDSDIRFTEYDIPEQIADRDEYIKSELEGYDEELRSVVANLAEALRGTDKTLIHKLHAVGPLIAEIAKNKQATPSFTGALLDYMALRLGFHDANSFTVETPLHRVVLTEKPKSYTDSFYVRSTPTRFNDIQPVLGIVGESENPWLALAFLQNDEAVRIPVQFISSIYKSVPK